MQTEHDIIIQQIGSGVPNADQYKRLSEITLLPHGFEALGQSDPFSSAYAKAAFELYLSIRGQKMTDYVPSRDEASPTPLPANIFTELVPWSFGDPTLMSEFLISWGHMLHALDLSSGTCTSILEYGPGTGQFLLILARLGYSTYGVDINADSVAVVKAQAASMGLTVQMQQAEFGEGFEGQRFDRIVFFEAFHHAFDFMSLLRRLRSRLNPGGKLILCGEPITQEESPSIPFPWGPRLDGLSAFCIRRFGWMELGFTWSFLREAMRRTGWRVRAKRMPGYGRADCYVAVPVEELRVGESWRLMCGHSDSNDILDGTGWSNPEVTHRWTVEPEAGVLLPSHSGQALSIKVVVANYLPIPRQITVRCGNQEASVVIPPGTESHSISLERCCDGLLEIKSQITPARELFKVGNDQRLMGIAVIEVLAVALAE